MLRLNVPRFFRQLFGIDFRSLACLRIGLAVIIIIDLLLRSRDLMAHYGDLGVLPRSFLLQILQGSGWKVWYSLYFSSGMAFFAGLLFFLNLFFALCLAFGFHTRVMTVLCWLFLVSLHNRNYMVLDSGDDYLRLMLFWLMFLPSDVRFSLDALAKRVPPYAQKIHLSWATLGLLMQLVYIYTVAGFLKYGSTWNEDETALQIVFYYDIFATPVAYWLRQFPDFLAFSTFLVMLLEKWGALLLFFPFFFPVFRLVGIAGYLGLHVGIALTMMIGVFPWTCMVALLMFLPSEVWEWSHVEQYLRLPESWVSRILQAYERWRPVGTGAFEHFGHRGYRSYLREGFCAFTMLVILFWNLQAFESIKGTFVTRPFGVDLVEPAGHYIRNLRLDQWWGMFSPNPASDDGWYVVAGKTAKKQDVDVYQLRKAPVTFEKPELVSTYYPNGRWRKYLSNIRQSKHHSHLPYYANYLCRRWNDQHTTDEKLESLSIYYMAEDSFAAGEYAARKTSLLEQKCPTG